MLTIRYDVFGGLLVICGGGSGGVKAFYFQRNSNIIRVRYLFNGGRWVAAGMIYVIGRVYLINQRSDDEQTARVIIIVAPRVGRPTFALECMFAYACA